MFSGEVLPFLEIDHRFLLLPSFVRLLLLLHTFTKFTCDPEKQNHHSRFIIMINNTPKKKKKKNATSFFVYLFFLPFRRYYDGGLCVGNVPLRLVPLGLGDGLVLGLAGAPQEEGDAQGGEGHDGEGQPVQLKGEQATVPQQSLISQFSESNDTSV